VTAGLALSAALAAPGAHALSRAVVLDHGRSLALLTRQVTTRAEVLVTLGELAFKSDFLLEGSPARNIGAHITCDTCHPDGGASRVIFFEGLSDKPGNLDVTNRAISLIEDGIRNPLNVPSIRGAAVTAPFARDGRFESVEDFTLFAIANEFAGGTPSDLVIESLVAYQDALGFADNALLDAAGRLTDSAPEAARRGEAVFARPVPGAAALSCAGCHVPADNFVDHASHDVGTGRAGRAGKAFDTPTLRDTLITPPYLHDGRYDTLAEVVDYFDGFFALDLSADERADLTAYLEAVGGGTHAAPAGDGAMHPETAVALLGAALAEDDWLLTRMLVPKLTTELADWRGGAGAPADAVITGWIARLRRIEAQVKSQDFAGARATLDELAAAIAEVAG